MNRPFLVEFFETINNLTDLLYITPCKTMLAGIWTRMFMRLGRAEKAGSGVDKIVSGWRYLGWPVPVVIEETRPDYVVLTMPVGASHKKPTRKTDKKDEKIRQILVFCKEPRSASEILEHLGLSDKKNFMMTYINVSSK